MHKLDPSSQIKSLLKIGLNISEKNIESNIQKIASAVDLSLEPQSRVYRFPGKTLIQHLKGYGHFWIHLVIKEPENKCVKVIIEHSKETNAEKKTIDIDNEEITLAQLKEIKDYISIKRAENEPIPK